MVPSPAGICRLEIEHHGSHLKQIALGTLLGDQIVTSGQALSNASRISKIFCSGVGDLTQELASHSVLWPGNYLNIGSVRLTRKFNTDIQLPASVAHLFVFSLKLENQQTELIVYKDANNLNSTEVQKISAQDFLRLPEWGYWFLVNDKPSFAPLTGSPLLYSSPESGITMLVGIFVHSEFNHPTFLQLGPRAISWLIQQGKLDRPSPENGYCEAWL